MIRIMIAIAAVLLPGMALAADVGTAVDFAPLLREVLLWCAAAVAAPAAALFVRLLLAAARWVGIEVEERRRARLQEMVERGIAYAAERGHHRLDRPMPILIRSQIIADAADYLARHGAETIRALRGNPADAAAMQELVRARGNLLLNKAETDA